MKIEIGKILKAQGIKGEVKIACYLDDSSMLKNVKQLYIGTNTYAVDKLRCDGAFCYVLLQGISDRNTAEDLRNWTVYADKEALILPQNRFFIDDLIDCNVTTNGGKTVGKVKNVLQYGAADVFICYDGKKEVSFPFLNDLVISINTAKKQVVVDEKRFNEVCVYED